MKRRRGKRKGKKGLKLMLYWENSLIFAILNPNPNLIPHLQYIEGIERVRAERINFELL